MSLQLPQSALRSVEIYLHEHLFEYFDSGVLLYHSLAEQSSSHPQDTKLKFMDVSDEDSIETQILHFGDLKSLIPISVDEAKKRNPNLETILQRWSDSEKGKNPSFKPNLPKGLQVI